MEEILTLFARTYYTLPIMVLMQLAAAIVGAHYRSKYKELKWFHFYPLISLLQTVISLIAVAFLDFSISARVCEATISVFAIIEACLIYELAFRIIKIQILRNLLIGTLISFCLYAFYYWITENGFFKSFRIIPMEAGAILIPTCIYFVQLFKLPATFNLFNQPTFWINIGILFTFSCTLPLSLLEFINHEFVNSNFYFYQINFVCYSILFLFVIRAYLCRSENQARNKFSVEESVQMG